jgi:Transcriptional regulator
MSRKNCSKDRALSVARELFLAEGLLQTNMDRVARMAGMTRRTLYRSFSSKESLAYAVAIGVLSDWNDEQRKLYSALEGTGADRLEAFLAGSVAILDIRRPMLRFLGEFDIVFQDSLAYRPSPEMKSAFGCVSRLSEDLIEGLLELGERDGSLRRGLEPGTLVPTITTTLWALAQRVALRDGILKEETGISGIMMARRYIELILEAIKP